MFPRMWRLFTLFTLTHSFLFPFRFHFTSASFFLKSPITGDRYSYLSAYFSLLHLEDGLEMIPIILLPLSADHP
ncbi:hypothetical protein DFH11DRAFT_1580088 [Phellopilus nigrolimitatus]|nr:hypothetical protein DFH11DRAFT_1580088 [Phellopilus nigrolimitatus]